MSGGWARAAQSRRPHGYQAAALLAAALVMVTGCAASPTGSLAGQVPSSSGSLGDQTPSAPAPTASSPQPATTPPAAPSSSAPSSDAASPTPTPTKTTSRSYPHSSDGIAASHVDGHPVVYLTYDDGPVPQGVPVVLAALARRHAVATFFVMGYLSARYPQLLRSEAAAGMAICNHTWSHKDLQVVSDAQVRWQLRSTQKAIKAAVGVMPDCLRPPYGAVDDRVRYLAEQQGLTAWLWNNDWTDGSIHDELHFSPAKAAARIISSLRPGSVVLMHDGETYGPRTAQMTDIVLAYIAKRGWKTATLAAPARPGATGPVLGGP